MGGLRPGEHMRRPLCPNCGLVDYSWRTHMPPHRCPETYHRGPDGLLSNTAALLLEVGQRVQEGRR